MRRGVLTTNSVTERRNSPFQRCEGCPKHDQPFSICTAVAIRWATVEMPRCGTTPSYDRRIHPRSLDARTVLEVYPGTTHRPHAR